MTSKLIMGEDEVKALDEAIKAIEHYADVHNAGVDKCKADDFTDPYYVMGIAVANDMVAGALDTLRSLKHMTEDFKEFREALDKKSAEEHVSVGERAFHKALERIAKGMMFDLLSK